MTKMQNKITKTLAALLSSHQQYW